MTQVQASTQEQDKQQALLERSRELFLAKVLRDVNERGCWEWGGAKYLNGKGLVRRRGKNWLAHRLAYVLFVGPIPDGMDVRHKPDCHNAYCINPEHLEPGKPTNKEEVERLDARVTAAVDAQVYPEGDGSRPSAMREFWAFRKSRPEGEPMEETRRLWKQRKERSS